MKNFRTVAFVAAVLSVCLITAFAQQKQAAKPKSTTQSETIKKSKPVAKKTSQNKTVAKKKIVTKKSTVKSSAAKKTTGETAKSESAGTAKIPEQKFVRSSEDRIAAPKVEEKQIAEKQSASRKTDEPKKAEKISEPVTQKIEISKAQPKKSEPKKTEAKKIETSKAEPKRIETPKVEAKKTDVPKSTEKVAEIKKSEPKATPQKTNEVASAVKSYEATKTVEDVAPPTPTSEVLVEINALRRNPQSYIRYLEDWKRNYNDKELRLSSDTFLTVEGAAAVDEAISFLKQARPAKELRQIKSLDTVAIEQLYVIEQNGEIRQNGDAGVTPAQLAMRFGDIQGDFSQITAKGKLTPRELVVSMLIGDGDRQRTYRNKLFNPNFKAAGAATANNEKIGGVSVIVLAGNFLERYD